MLLRGEKGAIRRMGNDPRTESFVCRDSIITSLNRDVILLSRLKTDKCSLASFAEQLTMDFKILT